MRELLKHETMDVHKIDCLNDCWENDMFEECMSEEDEKNAENADNGDKYAEWLRTQYPSFKKKKLEDEQ